MILLAPFDLAGAPFAPPPSAGRLRSSVALERAAGDDEFVDFDEEDFDDDFDDDFEEEAEDDSDFADDGFELEGGDGADDIDEADLAEEFDDDEAAPAEPPVDDGEEPAADEGVE